MTPYQSSARQVESMPHMAHCGWMSVKANDATCTQPDRHNQLTNLSWR